MPAEERTSRIEELEARVAELASAVDTPPASSRRHVLKLAGAAAAGATAALARSGHVAAVDGDPVTIGETRSTTPTSTDPTVLVYTNSAAPSLPGTTLPADLFLVRDEPAAPSGVNAGSAGHAAAVGGHSSRTVPNGVSGSTLMGGSGVVGHGSGAAAAGVYGIASSTVAGAAAGVRARSESGPTIQLEPVLTGVPTTGTWAKGALVADTAGRLWYNVTGGTPGTWVNVAQSYRAVTPFRVYDSREPQPAPGRIATTQSRTISVKDHRAVAGGGVVAADAVPAGTLAVTANITVVNTLLSGYLTVNPGGDHAINAATVNWSASDQILNNGVNVTINPATREVTVIAGGIAGSSTDFVVDITGFFL